MAGGGALPARAMGDLDLSARRRIAVLGSTVAEELGAPLGARIQIRGLAFTVVGVLAERGEPSIDEQVLVPLTTHQGPLFGQDHLSSLSVEVESEDASPEVQARIEQLLRLRHGLRPGAEDDFSVYSQTEMLETMSAVTGTFTALLGLLSLSGMLIKNGIVLVEEIDFERGDGKRLEEAIVHASISRLRPVTLAAATTILGMTPLLNDAFFVSMAVTIMGGLTFASVLTLVAAPVLYRLFFAREGRAERAAETGDGGATDRGRDADASRQDPAPRPGPVPGTSRITPGPLAPPPHVDVRL